MLCLWICGHIYVTNGQNKQTCKCGPGSPMTHFLSGEGAGLHLYYTYWFWTALF